jgi:hypothetical protein
VRAMLENTEIPMHLRRKRNGNSDVVPDNGGELLAINGGGKSGAKRLSNADAS